MRARVNFLRNVFRLLDIGFWVVGAIYKPMFKSVRQNSFKRYSFRSKRKFSLKCKQKVIQLLNCHGMMRPYIPLLLSIVVDSILTAKPFEINTNTHHLKKKKVNEIYYMCET